MRRAVSVALVGACAAALAACASERPAEPPPPYRVANVLKVGGEGRWDLFAVDPRTNRLYIPRSDHVIVVDADTGTVVGRIAGTKGVHGVALAPQFERGFTTDGQAGSMTVFDLRTLAVLGHVKAGSNPDGVLYDSATRRVFCFNGRSADATVVDADADLSRDVATRRVELGGKPELAVSDGGGQVFVNVEDKSEIVRIDARSLTVTARWPLAPGEEPSGLAFDAANKRLFAACANRRMVVVDAASGAVLAAPPIGDRPDGAGFDDATGSAFASCGDGTLSVVRQTSPGAFDAVQTLVTRPGARTMTVDPATHRAYLLTADFGPAPAPTAAQPRPRPPVVPGSFVVLVVGR